MSLTTPTTQEISDNIVAQISASLGQTVPLLPKSFIHVLAKALSGVFILLYKYQGFMFLQMFVSKASFAETTINGKTFSPLIEWGRLIGVGDPTPATRAELLIDIIVETVGGTLPAGTQLVNSANGVTYITIGAVSLSAATVQATIRASADQAGGGGAGAIGNLLVGDVVSFANPLGNVARDATVNSQTVTGADAEDPEVYRQRVVDRFQKRPQGGAYSDYEIWGEEVAGIINVYPYTSDCPGQVDLYCEATVASSGSADGIPTTAQLEAVLAAVELNPSGLANRRPAGALVNTFPISRVSFNVQVTGLLVDNLAQVQTDITAAITDYFASREPFITGLSILPRKDRVTRSAVSGVVDDIVSAAGGIFGGVLVTTSTIEIEAYSLGIGEKAKLGTVSFV